MKKISDLTYLVVAYQEVPNLDTDICVDWAIDMLTLGYETESLLILSGLSKPTNYFETISYLTSALRELNLSLKTGEDGIVSCTFYYIKQIIFAKNVMENLGKVSSYYIYADHRDIKQNFDLLYFAWDDLNYGNEIQYYWPDATLDNIEQITIEAAKKWLIENERSYTQGIS